MWPPECVSRYCEKSHPEFHAQYSVIHFWECTVLGSADAVVAGATTRFGSRGKADKMDGGRINKIPGRGWSSDPDPHQLSHESVRSGWAGQDRYLRSRVGLKSEVSSLNG